MAHYDAIQVKGFYGTVVEEREALRYGNELAREAVASERTRIRSELLAAIDFATYRPERHGKPTQEQSPLEMEIRAALDRICPDHEGTLDQSTGGTTSPSTTSSSEEELR